MIGLYGKHADFEEKMNSITQKNREPEWYFGQTIHIISGPFVDFSGEIYEIHRVEKKLRVYVNFTGRKTPVELDFNQVETIDQTD
jgi:transcription antitermination factor NusG